VARCYSGRSLADRKDGGITSIGYSVADSRHPEPSGRRIAAPEGGAGTRRPREGRTRMTAAQRREQLITVARTLFAEKGVEGTTVEEIAASAQVSKPVVYEHFGGKEGLYAVIVDREQRTLLEAIRSGIDQAKGPRRKVEAGTLALLGYIETHPDGFRIISRDAPTGSTGTSFATILSDVASQVEDILGDEFRHRGLKEEMAPMYAQMLVGMIAYTGQWWLDERDQDRTTVASNILNLAWNGLSRMVPDPDLYTYTRQD